MARHHSGTEKAVLAREARTASTRGHVLDTVDVKILSRLQVDGRVSNVNLAKHAGISAPPALRRTATLEERGIIQGYRADLDPKKFDYGVTAFVTVSLVSQSQADIQLFERSMNGIPNVRECHALSGSKDFLLCCVFHDLTECNDFVRGELLTARNIRTVNTTFAIKRVKHEPLVPLEQIDARRSLSDFRALRKFRKESEL